MHPSHCAQLPDASYIVCALAVSTRRTRTSGSLSGPFKGMKCTRNDSRVVGALIIERARVSCGLRIQTESEPPAIQVSKTHSRGALLGTLVSCMVRATGLYIQGDALSRSTAIVAAACWKTSQRFNIPCPASTPSEQKYSTTGRIGPTSLIANAKTVAATDRMTKHIWRAFSKATGPETVWSLSCGSATRIGISVEAEIDCKLQKRK